MSGRNTTPTCRSTWWGGHLWSPSHFAVSCGGTPLAIITGYIENQKRPD
ncbi:transposase [Actinoallomurus vinaceus]